MVAGDMRNLTALVTTDLEAPQVGTLSVDPESGLLRVDEPGAIRFGFNFGGHAFEAAAVAAEGRMMVEAVTTIGRVPYSIEDRPRRLDLLKVLGRVAEHGFQRVAGHDQVIRLRVETAVLPPATSNRMIAGIVEALLPSRPYLDLLTEMVRRPATKATVPARLA